ncbi:MAG: heme o synthase [Methylacidiphilales bacterium]|nr:heme o synthase [Candidatus Methylacidiphilales bacterium]MDW8349515.1 heme o synthase [Verrucomicrobiae bacterium]
MRDFLLLTKFRLTFLVLLTTAAGYYLGSEGRLDVVNFLWTILGTALLAAGASALNQVWEVEEDALMTRTKERPLPAGRRSPLWGQAWGVVMSCLGLGILAWEVNLLTALLGGVALGVYVFGYTPLKKRTELNTLVGGIPGAIPPVMGWTGAGKDFGWEAGVLFAVLFFWQMPHFLAIAWWCREDYLKAGFKMIGGEGDAKRVGRLAMMYAAALWPVSLLWSLGGKLSMWSTGLTFLLGGWLVWEAAQFWKKAEGARRLFFASIVYLPLILAVWCLGKR